MSDYWSQYWQQGHLTSFGKDIHGNYTGVLANTWQAWLNGLDKSEVVVDLGCGNGALLDLVKDWVQPDTQLVGVDAASLTVPERLAAMDNIRFLERTDIANMPLQDNSVSAVMSQYGIEYADLEGAIKDVARVLTRGGRFRFSMHDDQSVVVVPNQQILAAAQALIKPDGVVDRIRRLAQSLADFGQQHPHSEQCRLALNHAIDALINDHQQGIAGTDFPAFIQSVMYPGNDLAKRNAMCDLFEQEMSGLVMRLQELVQAALSSERKALFAASCEASQLTILSSGEERDDHGQLIGFYAEGVKR
ncbi:class I SAM-dependent methyltransferase [Aestuariibacter halophilus]|uniref:Class I SAM-dependent methyltransferase n=1 Tax=Fluctibacter halophilus TaxID=226011 RepID=A0ABS8G810_9ALTE|nr:class I SAM-dependent methyltransferase [Aestuariibacter halophilus]MCC2616673.1 class I SAM-dependent methyltransferase [Aestuariibacter halophilus]